MDQAAADSAHGTQAKRQLEHCHNPLLSLLFWLQKHCLSEMTLPALHD